MPSGHVLPAVLPMLSGASSPLTLPTTHSVIQVGTYNALTDTFTLVFDLNDGVHTNVHPKSLLMPAPDKDESRSNNIRTPGETIVREQWKNRHVTVEFSIRGSSSQDVINRIRALIQAIETPPYRLRIAFPGATQYTYADVVKVTHDIPTDTQQIVVNALSRLHIDFECMPGLPGDRVYVQNLALNPGFEAPSGPGVSVFSDSFATTNAYALQAGSAPGVASSVMTLTSGARVAFGSPNWSAINLWQIRWQWITGLTARFFLHYTDTNNWLRVSATNGSVVITHNVAGIVTNLATDTPALTNTNWYWLQVSQFPASPGEGTWIQATVLNDTAGAIGTQVTSIGGWTTDATIALTGRPQIEATGAALAVGGAFSHVHELWLFGPGGWTFQGNSGTANCSGAWEQTTTTYPSGPVASFGAARIDFPPVGTVSAVWRLYTGGGIPGALDAIPVRTPGDTMAAVARYTTSGLSGTATLSLQLQEYDAAGTFLRQTTVASGGRSEAGVWATLSGLLITGSGCAYLALKLIAAETVAAASANGTLWLDNVQVWNATQTGQASMAYHELRFPQAPAQLLVSGIQGDMPSPAFLALGTFVSSLAASGVGILNYWIGRRQGAGAAARLIGLPTTYHTPLLSTSSYGGYYDQGPATGQGAQVSAILNTKTSDSAGMYHLFTRAWTNSSGIGNVSAVPLTNVLLPTLPYLTELFVSYSGATVQNPFSAASTWTALDAGQVALPASAAGSVGNTDYYPTQAEVTFADSASGSTRFDIGYLALMPVDGELVTANLINQAPAPLATVWAWLYLDGLPVQQQGGPGLLLYANAAPVASIPIADPSYAIYSGALPQAPSTGLAATLGAEPYITVDPTIDAGSSSAQISVNQLLALVTDQSATVLPFFGEIWYSPLYLYPR